MRTWKCWLALALAMPMLAAGAVQKPLQGVTELPVMVVTGVVPGPGLWKVSKGEHVLWVLGTSTPLPANIQWESRDVEDAVAGSAQVLLEPSIKVKADVNFLGKLFLLPSAYSARKNEHGAKLDDILPPDVYARWLVQKAKYLGDDRDIERWRPLFAAQELYKKALKANGLSRSGGVESQIKLLAGRHGVAEVDTDYPVLIEHPSQAIKAFKKAAPNDTTCFVRTLDALEKDLPAMTQRANAWATGDLQLLRELPDSERQDVCEEALAGAGFARILGLDDVPAKARAAWLATAEKALATNRQTFAVLPIDDLLDANGYLAGLAAQGYVIEAPQE